MIVVTNRIRVKTGHGAQMAPRFTRSKSLCEFKGFHKVEVLVAELDDCDEMSVNMYWDSRADFRFGVSQTRLKQHTSGLKAAPALKALSSAANCSLQRWLRFWKMKLNPIKRPVNWGVT